MTASERRPGPCGTCNRTMPSGECPECWPKTFDPLYPVAVVGAALWFGALAATFWVVGLLLGTSCKGDK
jgi:hypothetical protein